MIEKGRRRRRWVAGAAAAGLLLLVGLVISRRVDQDVPIGMPARFDDFSFAVVDVRRLDEIDGLSPENGLFVVVRLGVRNGAKRVDYRLREETLVLEDLRGRRASVSGAGMERLRRTGAGLAGCETPIAAGKSCTTDLVFDVPRDLARPSLRFSFGSLTDVLLRIIDGRTRFLLEGKGR